MNARLVAAAILILAGFLAIWKLGAGGSAPETASPPPRNTAEEVRADTAHTAASETEAGTSTAGREVTGATAPSTESAAEVSAPVAPAAATRSGGIWLAGRVTDAAGTPVADAKLAAELVVHRGMFGTDALRAPLATDGEGAYSHPVEEEFLRRSTPLTLAVIDGDGTNAPRALFVVPTQLAPGEHDLGQAALSAPRLLAAGIARDLAGRPVASARVTARWSQPVTVPPGQDPARYLPELWWELEGVEALSGADGRFELRGVCPQSALRLEAQKEEYLPAEPVLVEAGATSVQLVLPQGGGLRGWVLLSDTIPRDRVRVEVRRGDDVSDQRRPALAEDGTFQVEGLPPGHASVRVVVEPEHLVLAEIEQVTLSGGEVVLDPRLDPLDLRDAATAVVLRVLDEHGAPLPDAVARADGAAFPDSPVPSWVEERTGELTVIGLGRKVDVTVWAAGYRAVELKGVEGERDVRLAPGPRVRARVASAPLLRGAEGLALMLEVYDGEIVREVSVSAAEPGLETELPASHAGPHRVSLWLVADGEAMGRTRVMEPRAWVDIEVGGDGYGGVAEVEVSEDGLQAARDLGRGFGDP